MNPKGLNILILAAGKSTRMKSDLPKVLHKLCGLSLLERSLRAVLPLKPTKLVLVLGHKRELVEKELARVLLEPEFLTLKVELAHQKEQKGTADAASAGLAHCEPLARVLIMPGDAPLLTAESLQPLLSSSADLALLSLKSDSAKGFGRIVRDKNLRALRIVEEKDASAEERSIEELNASFYCLQKELLERALSTFNSQNAQGEYYLTDLLSYVSAQGLSADVILSERAEDLLGANTRAELAGLEALRRAEINSAHMLAGVSFEDPSRAYIDEDVKIQEDCFIGAGTRLKGKTELARGVFLEGESLIVDTKIGAGTKIKLASRIESSIIGESCSIGPFAQLRPGSVLASHVKVGNFVEVKNSKLADRVSAGHLSYLGDAELGEGVNVGAGTITCNYDGEKKHRTKIGKEVFIGSNTALVAPLEIGNSAVIGAGSVITKNVPENALALERSEQKIIPNYSKRKRKQS